MGGAVMLLIAATVGITYGWTPDGGRGVKYIIQIPPDQVEQVVRSGEIASRIPTEIQGHVSEVVVRVGNGSLPRVTPSNLTQADYQATEPDLTASRNQATDSAIGAYSAGDRSPLPIPAMHSPMELSPIRNPDATAMMKPAPQGGGMNLPGSLGTSQSNTPRPSTNPLTNPSPGSATNASANSLTAPPTMNSTGNGATGNGFNFNLQQSARDVLGNATDAARNSINDAVDRAFGSDDPRSRLGQSNAANIQNSANQNSANQAGGNPLAANPSGTNSSGIDSSVTSTRNPGSASASEQDWYDLRGGSRRRPSTDPIETNVASTGQDNSRSSSPFDNSNFGRLPGGLDTPDSQANSRYSNDSQTNDPNRNSGYDYDPRLTIAQAQALPVNGYSFDSQGYAIDRQGYRLNRFGQRTDDVNRNQPAYNTQTGNTQAGNTQTGNTQAGNGSQTPLASGTHDGRNPALVQPPLAPAPGQTAATGSYPPGNYANANNPYGYPANNGSQMYPAYGDPRYNDPRYTQLVGNPSATGNPNPSSGLAPIGDQTGHTGLPPQPGAEDEPRSASDVSGTTTADRYREALQNPEQVAAQPIFNAMLLLSVVTNAYLLFWLKNLRLQFRDTVAAKRSSGNAGSLATSV